MTGELITTGVTFGAGRNSINDAFSGTAQFNNITLDSGANLIGGVGGGIISSGGTDLYNVFLTSATDATTASNGLTKTGDNITLGGVLTASTEIGLSGLNLSLIGGNVGINTTPSTSFDISGLTSIRGQVGSDTLSPHLEIYHNTQAQPVAQYQHWSSDNISISNGLYWDSGSWRNSDTGSNFQIYKWADAFRFNYGAGGTLGAAATVGGGFALTNAGNLKIGGFTQLGTVTATEKVDIDGNIIIRGTANITGDTMLASSGGTIYSGGTNLYNIFGTGGNLWSASTGANSIISNNGTGNVASGNTSISIGWSNNATGTLATVVGGYGNITTNQYGSIFGGNNNTVTGDRSSIICGENNTVNSWNSFIAGGYYNSAVTGAYSSVIAGLQNIVTGTRSSIIGSSALTNPYDDTVMLTNLRAAENGGVIYSGGTDLYSIFSTGGGSTTAGNGLTKTGDNITFGGTLTGDTSIAIGTNELLIDGGSSGFFMLSGNSAVDNQFVVSNKNSDEDATLVVQKGKALLYGQNSAGSKFSTIQATAGSVPGALIQIFNGLAVSSMLIQESAMTISDNINLRGINYDANYHANYVNRTLVDYEYVNNHVASAVTVNSTYDYGTQGMLIDWDVLNESTSAKVILSGNVTLNVLNASSGDFGTLKITQDGVGSRTLTLGAGTHRVANGGSGAITLTSTAGAVDVITFFYDGSEFNWSAGYNYT